MEAPLNLRIPRPNRDPIEMNNDFPIDLTTPHFKNKRRSSFFNIVQEKVEEEEVNQKRKEYIEKLQAESDNWRAIVNEQIKKKSALKNIKVVHDSSVLPQERKDYLAGAVDITQFVKNTEALSDCVHFYLQELEWKDMQIETNEQMLDEKIINFAFESIAKNEST